MKINVRSICAMFFLFFPISLYCQPEVSKDKSLNKDARICFAIYLHLQEKTRLYETFIKGNHLLEPYITKPDPYHIGISCVRLSNPDPEGEQAAVLKVFLGKSIQHYVSSLKKSGEELIFYPFRADRYTVGTQRSYNYSSIVLYTKQNEHFIHLNELIKKRVEFFNHSFRVNAYLEDDYLPCNYVPHLTLVGEDKLAKISEMTHSDLQVVKNNIIQSYGDAIFVNLSFQLPVPGFRYEENLPEIFDTAETLLASAEIEEKKSTTWCPNYLFPIGIGIGLVGLIGCYLYLNR